MSAPTTPLPFPQLTQLQLNIMRIIAVYNVFVCVPACEGDKDYDKRAEKHAQCMELVEHGLIQEATSEAIQREVDKVKEETGRQVIVLSFTQLGEAMFGAEAIQRVSELAN